MGDLCGICEKLDYLRWLGVDALWLSPFYRSPMRDFGYDVSDHCTVDPLFGTLADFERLLAGAHARGLRVIVDWVPAHTSSDHPWFRESRRSRADAKRDWYVWRDPKPDGSPPNNWTAAFPLGTSAWTLDPTSGQMYLHSFLREQPDLNWENPAVREAMLDVLRFWLDRGVDGFRADVVHNIGKDPALLDVDPALAAVPHCVLNDDPRTHDYLREIRRLLDSYPGDRMMVGEVFLLDSARVAHYTGDGDELHMSFNFPPLYAPWRAEAWLDQIDRAYASLEPRGAWPTWVLSNHDQPRHRTRYATEARARAAAFLLLGLKGTPFLYMGEELGLEDAEVPPERRLDPGGRDGCRAPLPWRRARPWHGWMVEPWLPFPADAAARSVEAQQADPGSMLQLYRALLAARRGSPALAAGEFVWRDAPSDVLCWERWLGSDRRLLAVSMTPETHRIAPAGEWRIEVASEANCDPAMRFDGELAGDSAVLLAPC